MPRLFGRSVECQAIDRMLDGLRAGAGGVLVISGEAGSGKSALVEYAVVRAAGTTVLRVPGLEPESRLPFGGVHRLLQGFLDRVGALPPLQREAVTAALGEGGTREPDPFLVGAGVLRLLSDAAAERPVVVVVDDAHLLDDATLRTLAFTARRLHGGLALVFTVEGPSPVLAGLPELPLEGISKGAARQLLAENVRGSLDAGVREIILDEARGNPLALLEIVDELTPVQLSGGAPLPGALRLSGRLEERALARLRALPEPSRTLLTLLAAEPEADERVVAAAATHLGLGEESWLPLRSANLVRAEEPWRIADDSLARLVYDSAPVDVRQRVHRVLARSLSGKTHPDLKAWHLSQVSSQPREETARSLESAAATARRRGRLPLAARLLDRSAQLTPDARLRAARSLRAARVYVEAGLFDGVEALLDRALAALPEPREAAKAKWLRGAVALARRQNENVVAVIHDAAIALEEFDVREARLAHLEALEAALYTGHLDPDRPAVAMAEAAARAPRVENGPQNGADVLLDGVATLFTEGHPAAAPTLRRAFELLRDEDNTRWLVLAALAACEIWDSEAMVVLSTRAVEQTRGHEARGLLPDALAALGYCELLFGRFDRAQACFREARRVARESGNPGAAGAAAGGDLLLAAWRGAKKKAYRLADSVLIEASARGMGLIVGAAHRAIALLELGFGRYDLALQAAQDASDTEDFFVRTRTLPDLVEAAVRCGEMDLARDAIRRLEPTVDAARTSWGTGLLARSRALVADDREAEPLYQEAISHLKHCRVTPELARAHLLYGEWLRRQRRRREAREELGAARRMFVSMGAQSLAERAGLEALATVAHARPRTYEKAGQLTPQEQTIARLAAEGHSNREIAARLMITPRTVEYHLGKVFRKLGLTSRAQLARALAGGTESEAAASESSSSVRQAGWSLAGRPEP